MISEREITEAAGVFYDGFLDGVFCGDQYCDWMRECLGGYCENTFLYRALVPWISSRVYIGQVTDFGILVEGLYSRVDGKVYIKKIEEGISSDAISMLTDITGDLIFTGRGCWSRRSSKLFSSLRFIGGSFKYTLIPGKEYLNDFPVLESIGDSVIITSNKELKRISGFDSLRRVKRNIDISINPVLTTIDGFSSLRFIGGRVRLDLNRSFRSWSPFTKFILHR